MTAWRVHSMRPSSEDQPGTETTAIMEGPTGVCRQAQLLHSTRMALRCGMESGGAR